MAVKTLALSLLILSTGCGTAQLDPEIKRQADEQVEGGLIMPTPENPIVYGTGGMQFLDCGLRDGGCYDESAMDFRGISGDFVVNWTPGNGDALLYGTYTPEGAMYPTLVTKFPYPSAARGNVADLDAEAVDWATVEETGSSAEAGLNDGWLNIKPNMFGVVNITDCGVMHTNMLVGFDEDGNYDTFRAAAAAALGDDYCDDWE